MKNYEVPFTLAKKDKDGYATLRVKFDGGRYVPVNGRPLPLDKDETPEREEVNRLNLTRWHLKDIPEIAKLVGSLCGNSKNCTRMLYWNGGERAWKFYDDDPVAKIKSNTNDIIKKLNEKIADLENVFYKPHVDEEGNHGDDSVHAVYDALSSNASDYDPDYDPTSDDELDPVVFIKNIPAKIGLARKQHKKLPYEEIGEQVYEMFSTINSTEIGKILYRLVKEIRDDV